MALARWILEAAGTGVAQPGTAAQLFEICRPALNPSAPELLTFVRAAGHVTRANVTRAIGQCAAYQDLWGTLAASSAFVEPREGLGDYLVAWAFCVVRR